MIGTTVSHYRILSQLGAGGMGVVYEAEDIRLDRKVALKFLAPELTSDHEARHRFVNEAKAASSLEHPAICTVHEIDQTDDGRTFMVMPSYEGQTLQKHLDQGPLPVEEAVDIARQMVRGMAVAHAQGIVHRDLKPGNLFLTTDGRVVILDFGLAKLSGATRVTRDGSTLGTPAYLSPEQARGQEADARSDVWALGAVLFEMLAGRPPFTSDYAQALIYAIQNEEPPPLVDVSETIAAIVARCLAKDPADRYTDADELRKDLKRASRGEGLRPRPRRRWLQLLAPLILAAAVVGFKLLQDGEPDSQQAPEHRKSIAVMPFQNLTGDQNYDVWILGLPELMNLDLTNSQELYVLDHQTLQEVLGDVELVQAATFSIPRMRDIAERVSVETLIQGSILKAGPNLRLQLKLLDAGTGASLATMRVDGRSEDDFFAMADSLTAQVRDLMEIDALKQWNPELAADAVGTRSAEAFRLYLEGVNARRKAKEEADFSNARAKLTRAVEIDSTFYIAWLELAGTYAAQGDQETYFRLFAMVEEHADQLPLQRRLRMELYITPKDSGCDRRDLLSNIQICKRLIDLDPEARDNYRSLGMSELWDEDFESAAESCARWEEISRRWGNYDTPLPGLHYWAIGEAFYRAGRIEEAIKVFTRGRDNTPLAHWFEWLLALVHLSQSDTTQAAVHRRALKEAYDEAWGENERRDLRFDAMLYTDLEDVDRAVALWRIIVEKYPDDIKSANELAYLLIDQEIDVGAGVAIVEDILDRQPDLRSPDRRVQYPWYRVGGEPDFLGTLGWGYYKQGKYQQAVAVLEIACEQWLIYHKPLDRHLDLAQAALDRSDIVHRPDR